jgi:serine phosphatase RsbU (regulator of sigma subunit)
MLGPVLLRLPGYQTAGKVQSTSPDGCGDRIEVVRQSDDQVTILMLDATGHGAKADREAREVLGVLTAHTDDWVRDSPKASLEAADELLSRLQPATMSMSGTVIDARHNVVRHANAGLPYPLIMHADGSHDELNVGGLYVGSGDYSLFKHEEAEQALRPGDVLLLRSDGIDETRLPDGLLRAKGVAQLLGESRWLSADQIADNLLAVSNSAPQETWDDKSILAIKRDAFQDLTLAG